MDSFTLKITITNLDINESIKLKFPFSRLLVDVERFENDYLEPMSKVGMGCIYQKTHNGNPLKDTDSIKTELINKFYKKHHKNFTTLIDKLLTNYSKVLIIDCHSYPKNFLEYELNKKMNRPEICIGTDNFHTPES